MHWSPASLVSPQVPVPHILLLSDAGWLHACGRCSTAEQHCHIHCAAYCLPLHRLSMIVRPPIMKQFALRCYCQPSCALGHHDYLCCRWWCRSSRAQLLHPHTHICPRLHSHLVSVISTNHGPSVPKFIFWWRLWDVQPLVRVAGAIWNPLHSI